MASLPDPRRYLTRFMNSPTGVAEQHLPLPIAGAIAKARGRTLEGALRGKTVLLTGASSGIGEATALKLARARGRVLLVSRGAEKLADIAALVAEHGGEAHVHTCDLSSGDDIKRMTAEVLEQHGGVDIVVNSAGRSIRRSLKFSWDREHDFERTMELNYMGPVRLALAFLPGMRERRFGHIVNVSSAAVQIRTPRFAAYTASKAALDAFSDCAAAEFSHRGICFTTISMPLVRTPMIEPTAMYANFPSLSPDEAAGRVAQAIIHRPRRIGTPLGALVNGIEAVDPVAMETIRNRGYHSFPESGGRAPAQEGDGADAGATPSETPES